MTDSPDTLALEMPVDSKTEASDGELVARVLAGDEAAFEEIFNRHRRRVALIAGRFFRQREQVEEIVQESFMKAYFALPNFNNAQEASFASWLARIAFNTCYDELRRIKRRPESAATALSDEEVVQLKKHISSETAGQGIETATVNRDLADKLLSRLSAEDRRTLVMLDAEEMTVAEIAKLMGWSESKVKVRAHRARAALRRVLHKLL
ncbi:MAG: sigma-70 family RNA polymerase sigma factor [Pyrinomonadaceae bacterium]